LAAAACALIAALLAPALASADSNTFTCRASAARATLGGNNAAEPIVANRPNNPCVADAAGVPDAQTLGSGVQQAEARGAYAETALANSNNNQFDQTATAKAAVAHADVLANPAGGYVVNADALSASVSAHCFGGTGGTQQPSSNLGTVSVGGHPVDLNGPAQQVFDGISGSPLGAVVKIQTNQLIRDGNTVTRRALEVTVTLGGTVVSDTVVGEASAGVGKCVSPALPTGATPPPCPAGYQFDPSGQCVRTITVAGTGDSRNPCPADAFLKADGTCFKPEFVPVSGNSPGVTVVPTGAVFPLGADVSSGRLGPCASKKFAASFVILGTDGDDTITGTNQNDIILAGGGNDRGSGGDGNDCIRGEAGNDRVDGSNADDTVLGDAGKNVVIGGRGNDTLRGDKGSDKLDGGIGNDNLRDTGGRNFLLGGAGTNRITGGPGRDFITTGSGRNVVNAGRGNDQINAAKAGPPTRGTCGPGRDVERGNKNEMRTLRGCERKFIVFLTH
jgi:Ca2+-binding RTX toxin-like protein